MELITELLAKINWTALMFTALRIVLVLLLIGLLLRAMKRVLDAWQIHLRNRAKDQGEIPSEAAKRAETLVRLVRQAAVIGLWVMGMLIILRELGISIGPILAGAGVVGLAVGFGAQNLVRDIIAGFFFVLENQLRVGDVAIINGREGLVEAINFRTTILRDIAGIVHIFPNGTITTLSNMTNEWSAYVMDLGVAYKEDVDHVMQLMQHVAEEMRSDIKYHSSMLAPLEIFGVDNFVASAVMIKARLKTRPSKQWEVGREYRRRLKKRFDSENVEIKFP